MGITESNRRRVVLMTGEGVQTLALTGHRPNNDHNAHSDQHTTLTFTEINYVIHVCIPSSNSMATPPYPTLPYAAAAAVSIIHQIPPKHRPLTPIHRQQHPRPETHALRKIHAPPQIHGQQATTEAQSAKVEDGRIANVGQTAQVVVFERFVHGVIQVAVIDLVSRHPRGRLGEFAEFPSEVLTLLMRALRRGGQGGEFGVDLVEQFVHFAEIQCPAFVLVVLLEEFIEAAEMVGSLRETFLDSLRDMAPFGECNLHLFGVFSFFDGERAEEGDEVVGDVVLDGGAVADGVDGAERGAVKAEVGVGLQGVAVGLNLELLGDAFAEFGLRYKETVSTQTLIASREERIRHTDTRRPQTEAQWQFLRDGLPVLVLLREEDLIRPYLLDPGVRQDLHLVMCKPCLGKFR